MLQGSSDCFVAFDEAGYCRLREELLATTALWRDARYFSSPVENHGTQAISTSPVRSASR